MECADRRLRRFPPALSGYHSGAVKPRPQRGGCCDASAEPRREQQPTPLAPATTRRAYRPAQAMSPRVAQAPIASSTDLVSAGTEAGTDT